MSVRHIARHCQRAMGMEVSHDTISKITDEVLEEVGAWQVRAARAAVAEVTRLLRISPRRSLGLALQEIRRYGRWHVVDKRAGPAH
jgi:hypothetical protein